jgi:peroxiredoxin 2/4
MTNVKLGDEAPDFTARTTQGPVTLSDFRGRWLILFAHPGDFTPVCTSEFVALAQAADQFAALDCALLGLSVDSLYAHLTWVRLIHDRFGIAINFPIAEDPTLEVARAYGMVAPDAIDASGARSTYFIDPLGIVRAITCYPHDVGRSVTEMLRLLRALQRVDQAGLLAPAEWQPGLPLLAAPDARTGQVLAGESPCDWFDRPVADDHK